MASKLARGGHAIQAKSNHDMIDDHNFSKILVSSIFPFLISSMVLSIMFIEASNWAAEKIMLNSM